MAADADRARAIFLEALDKPSHAERTAFVAQACGDDHKLRRRVDALLRAHDTPFEMLDRPAAEHFAVCPDDESADAASTNPRLATMPASEQQVLALLSPSTRPGSLGRLAHYEVLEIRGQGGFGTVFRCFDDKLHRMVAIKMLSPALAVSGTARQRFLREARAAAAVRHEHVVDIHAVEEQPVPFLVMEYIDGQTLQQKLDRNGPLPIKDILRVGYQVSAGLSAAHRQGLIHRDIKPSNILLENKVERVKLSDFGVARAVDDASLTTSGQIAGTPMYMSPEQAESAPVDHRSDLFSLGSVLYTLCTGHPPFRAANGWAVLKRVCEDTPRPIRECNPEIPEWLAAIVARLMAKRPEERFASAQEVADLLARCLYELRMYGEVQATRLPIPVPHSAIAIAPAVASAARVPGANGDTSTTPRPPSRPRFRLLRPRRRTAVLAVGILGVAALAWYLHGHDAPVEQEEVKPAEPAPVVAKTPAPRPVKPLAQRTRNDIVAELLAPLGNRDEVPPDLVAVLGDVHFVMTGGRVGGIATDPNGRYLAAGCGTDLLLFEARTGRQVRRIIGHPTQITHVAFDTHGGRLITGSDDGIARLWEVETGRLLGTFEGHTGAVLAGCFTPDDRTLITGSADRTARIWDVKDPTNVQKLDHLDHVLGVAISPDGKSLATACKDSLVRVWDATNNYEMRHALTGHGSDAPAVAFSPDGRWLVTGGSKLKVWDAASLAPVYTLPAKGNWIGFGEDGKTLLGAGTRYARGESYVATRWDLATGKKLPELTFYSKGDTGAFAVSADGKTIYVARTRRGPRTVRAYDTATGALLFPEPRGHRGQVTAVAFSPNGEWLATGSYDRTARLWHLAGWPEGDALPPVYFLQGPSEPVVSVQFSPDGKVLATGSLDNLIILWDAATRQPLRTLKGYSSAPSRIAFSPDGTTIAAGLHDGTIRFWDVASGAEKKLLAGHAGAVPCVAYSPDGKRLVSAGLDRTLQVRDLATDQRLDPIVLRGQVEALAFTADGKRLITTTVQDGRAMLDAWDADTWQRTEFRGHHAHVPALAFNGATGLAATGSHDRTVRLWDLRDALPRVLTLGYGLCGEGPDDVAFSRDGRYLATANSNGTATIFKVPPPAPPYQPGGPHRPPPDEQALAQMSSAADALDASMIDGDLRKAIGDPAKGLPGLVAVLGGTDGHEGQVLGLAVSPDGKRLASVGADRYVHLWDLATGKQIDKFSGHQCPTFAIAFSPDGERLASASIDGTIRLWDAATGNALCAPLVHGGDIRGIAFTPDGNTLAAASVNVGIKLWDVRHGRLLRTLWGAGDFCSCVAVSPDGKTLVSGHEDGFARLWDIATGWQVATLGPHPFTVRCVAFTPDGQSLIAGGKTFLRIWDIATRKPKQDLRGHDGNIVSCAVRADGGLLASVGEADGTLRLWQLNDPKVPSRQVRLFPPETKYLHAVTFTPDGRHVATANPDGTIYVLRLAARSNP